MKKVLAISVFVTILLVVGIFVIGKSKKTEIVFAPEVTHEKNEVAKFPADDEISRKKLFVSGWVPYWEKVKGTEEFEKNISDFSEIHPFAFGVNRDGSLSDKLEIKKLPWPELVLEAKKNNIPVVPTILWTDASAMHRIFSDENLLKKHVDAIAGMLEENDFSGVDIDYEGKDEDDRDLFSSFLKDLHQKLSIKSKTLNCTVEVRTDDVPPADWKGKALMAWANDFQVLNEACDSVTIMAYDQIFQTNGHEKIFDSSDERSAPNADNQWVEEVIKYALKTISKNKLILGVPTYGWEFAIQKISSGYRYTTYQSLDFRKALDEAQLAKVVPIRTNGGELEFSYDMNGQKHLVVFSDDESVKGKMALAKKYNLKGMCLFKIDGGTDPKIFSVLKQD